MGCRDLFYFSFVFNYTLEFFCVMRWRHRPKVAAFTTALLSKDSDTSHICRRVRSPQSTYCT
jgi:hypothetical protein